MQNSFFFGAKIPQSSHFLKIGSSLGHIIFGTAIFSEELFRTKISKKELLFQSRYFCTVSTWQHFRITYFFWRAVFLEQLRFQKTLPSIAAIFSEELLLYNLLFQKSYYFTATVPFHSCTSYLFIVIK